jgi:hypothetical protein
MNKMVGGNLHEVMKVVSVVMFFFMILNHFYYLCWPTTRLVVSDRQHGNATTTIISLVTPFIVFLFSLLKSITIDVVHFFSYYVF